jgi:hypothetical protein
LVEPDPSGNCCLVSRFDVSDSVITWFTASKAVPITDTKSKAMTVIPRSFTFNGMPFDVIVTALSVYLARFPHFIRFISRLLDIVMEPDMTAVKYDRLRDKMNKFTQSR